MKHTLKRLLATVLACALLLTMCSFALAEEQQLTTITIYPANGSLASGTVEGWRGEYFASKGLKIEVWAYSDEKTNAILASGDLPDIMYVNDDIYETMINAGMLLDLDQHMEQMPNTQTHPYLETALNYVRTYKSAETGKLYFMPLFVGTLDGSDETERYALRLNWEFYEAIGCPEFNDIWELIPIVKQMLEANPTGSPNGLNDNMNYGTVLNSGSDTNCWGNIAMPYNWSGYDPFVLPCLLEADMIEGEYYSILNKDSKYYESLKWYNAMYREGLIDPDSINLDRPTQKAKVDAGNVMLPSGTNPGWRPFYYQYLLDDTRVYYPDFSTYGTVGIGINAQSQNIDAALNFLNIIASADEYLNIRQGVDGEQWYSDGEGHAFLTDKFIESKNENKPFIMSSGEEYIIWNTAFITTYGADTSYTDKDGNPLKVNINAWKEFQELNNTGETYMKWAASTGHTNWYEWVKEAGKLWQTSPIQNVKSFISVPDDMMQLTIDALRDAVVGASWRMVYAESDEAFDAIWDQMVEDCNGLGAQDVIDWRLADLAAAKEKQDALTAN